MESDGTYSGTCYCSGRVGIVKARTHGGRHAENLHCFRQHRIGKSKCWVLVGQTEWSRDER